MIIDTVIDIVRFLLILGVLVIGHELGHFLAARLFGIRVEEFGLGLPPRLKTLFEVGGTKFSLNWIPFGGFVRITGENDPDVEGGLANSPKGVRVIILFAGPAVNILLAIIAFTFASRLAALDPSKILVTGVSENTPAEQAGILPGDLVLKVDDVTVDNFDTLINAVGERAGNEIHITLDRDGEILTLSLIPRTTFPDGQGAMGVAIGYGAKDISWGEAIGLGIDATIFQFRELISLPGKLLTSEIKLKDVGLIGPLGMGRIFSEVSDIERSAQRLLVNITLFGGFSAGLALANLLPIPALDGGRLIFILIEFLIGKRISPRFEGIAHTIGFAFLLVLLIFVTISDIMNPFSILP
jgi:regulator of sigma E protease